MKCKQMIAILALAVMSHASLLKAQSPPAAAPRTMHTYRLTYALTDLDGTRKTGTQMYTLTADPGETARVHLNSKVPIASGGQFSFYDIGLVLEATLKEFENGVQVETNVRQSTLSGEPTSVEDRKYPVIREADLLNTAILSPGKRVQIGSLDIPGSTRHIDVEVSLQRVE